jgi:DNA-binding winged helix-turn-helix (wHTH) protein
MHSQGFWFGQFRLDAETDVLLRNNVPVPVGHRATCLLRALLNQRGQPVSRAELMEAVWPGLTLEDSNLSVQVASLRKVLGKSPEGDQWIATVPRVGYRFVGNVSVLGTKPRSRSSLVDHPF